MATRHEYGPDRPPGKEKGFKNEDRLRRLSLDSASGQTSVLAETELRVLEGHVRLTAIRFIAQVEALRSRAMTIVHPEDLDGMITFPPCLVSLWFW